MSEFAYSAGLYYKYTVESRIPWHEDDGFWKVFAPVRSNDTCYPEAAYETARAEDVNPEFIYDDIRRFVRTVCFDGAINMFASFGYFENEDDDEQVVRNIYTSLKPRGKFLVEMFGKELVVMDFRESKWFEYEGMYVLSEYEILENWTIYRK